MRLSKLFFKSFKDAPQDADIASHQLLERGGYIVRLSRGLYSYAPLMWKVLDKLKKIIREELNKIGSQEIQLPELHPKEIWEKSGRWAEYRAQNLLFTIKNREDHEYCLAATHEEGVTLLVKQWIDSYKKLPINLFQISNKFRDEIRPRFGLMRAKAFIMKDAYAFCSDENEMNEEYGKMRKAYQNILDRLGLNYVIVQADPGKIGQGRSEEFQVLADVGEDLLLVCEEYAFNVEKATSILKSFQYESEKKTKKEVLTPNMKTIKEISSFLSQPVECLIKTLVFKLIFSDREKFIAVGVRGDRQVNKAKILSHFAPLDIEMATDEEIAKVVGSYSGFVGPIGLSIPFYADHTMKEMTNFTCGANKKDAHITNANFQDVEDIEFIDLLLAEEGDRCPFVENGIYEAKRGIEVGHIFNLGTKYSESFKANFQDKDGKIAPFWMGSYGIGVGRLAQACVEQLHDDQGIIWPDCLAPYKAVIIPVNVKNEEQYNNAELIYRKFLDLGIDVLFDDRKLRIGFKIRDSNLLGVPYKIILGSEYENTQNLEIEPRVGAKISIHHSKLEAFAKENLI